MVSGCFLDCEQAKADSYGLKVGKVDGVWFRWVNHEVASGVRGFTGDVIWLASRAVCEVV